MLTGGTDVHLVLCDLRESTLDGKQAEDRLASVGITVNRNAVPFDPRPPAVSSGLRIGTPALATRGLGVDDFAEVGKIIASALQPGDFEARRVELAERVQVVVERYPLYAGLGAVAAFRGGACGPVGRRGAVAVFWEGWWLWDGGFAGEGVVGVPAVSAAACAHTPSGLSAGAGKTRGCLRRFPHISGVSS